MEHSLSNVQAKDNPSPGDSPPGVDFPYGFFEFTVNGVTPGGSTTVTIYLPAGANPNTYYKYGPTPGDSTDHWYEFLYDGQTGAEIAGNIITLHFVDGQRGDDDLTANGIIVDQGAPGVKQKEKVVASAIPTLNEWGIVLFVILMGMMVTCRMRKKAGLMEV